MPFPKHPREKMQDELKTFVDKLLVKYASLPHHDIPAALEGRAEMIKVEWRDAERATRAAAREKRFQEEVATEAAKAQERARSARGGAVNGVKKP